MAARCLLASGEKVIEAFTDEYGDFWFKDLAIGKYNVSIEAKGFEDRHFSNLNTTDDINLGDIPLIKQP